jgi:hypothetical protein
MRLTLSILAILVFLVSMSGCSGSDNNPTQTSTPAVENTSPANEILYKGTFEIDLPSQTITMLDDRQSDTVYNITGFLPNKCPGGCFRFRIIGIVGTVLEIELTLENPMTIQAYDLRLVYLETYGKTIMNPDSYTDFLGAPVTSIFPFTAFMQETSDRAFPVGPGGIDTQILFLDYPAGAIASVNYAITASLPGQTLEPYEIRDMLQTGSLTPTGGSALISCLVDDHQNDINGVFLNASPITGGILQLTRHPGNPSLFETTVSNTQGAPEGTYIQMIMARSSNPQNISTYNYVEITVTQGSANVVACFTAEDVRMEVDPTVHFDASCSYDNNGHNISNYAWDYNYDGTFAVDENTTTPFASHQYSEPGTYSVALVVTNDIAETSTPFIYDVTVHGWKTPVRLTSSDTGYTDMWWCVDQRIATTSDGIAHIIAFSYYPEAETGHQSRVEYFKCDTSGLISSDLVYEGYIIDIGIQTTPDDEFYAFYMKGDGDIVYRIGDGTVFGPEVFAFTKESGKYADSAAYAVNNDGDVMVMMNEYGGEVEGQSEPNPAYVSYAVDEGSGFSPKTTLATPDRWITWEWPGSGSGVGIMLNVTADSTGTFHMAWDGLPVFGYYNRQVWYASYNGSLSATSEIAATSTDEFFPLLRVDSDDNVYCGYRTGQDMMAIKPSGNSTFNPGFLVAEYPANNWTYHINPANGQIMHIFDQYDSATSDYNIVSKIYNTSDSPSEMLDALQFRVDDSVNTRQWWPNVTYGQDGHWYAVWDDQRDLPQHISMGQLYYGIYW